MTNEPNGRHVDDTVNDESAVYDVTQPDVDMAESHSLSEDVHVVPAVTSQQHEIDVPHEDVPVVTDDGVTLHQHAVDAPEVASEGDNSDFDDFAAFAEHKQVMSYMYVPSWRCEFGLVMVSQHTTVMLQSYPCRYYCSTVIIVSCCIEINSSIT